MRLSTALTPRVVACAEEHSRHVALPRGCVGDLRDLLADHGVGLRLDDQRVLGESLKARFHGHLTEAQEQAAKSLLAHDLGVFVAPPGVGRPSSAPTSLRPVVGARLSSYLASRCPVRWWRRLRRSLG